MLNTFTKVAIISVKSTGELAERLNAAVLKTVKDASPSGVRIPNSPQNHLFKSSLNAGFFI